MMYAPKKPLTRSWPQSKMLFAFRSLLKSGGAMDIKLRQYVHELNDSLSCRLSSLIGLQHPLDTAYLISNSDSAHGDNAHIG